MKIIFRTFLLREKAILISAIFVSKPGLSPFEYDLKYKDHLKNILLVKLRDCFTDDQSNEKNFRKRITEIKGQLVKVEERFVLGYFILLTWK